MRYGLVLTLLAVLLAPAEQADAQQSEPSQDRLRIMPIGDSITEGSAVSGGYRLPLFELLTESIGMPNFVGRRRSRLSDPGGFIENDHDGYPGYRIDEIASGVGHWGEGPGIEQRLDDWDPAIVLLHAGTNDVLQNYYFDGDPDLGIPNAIGRLEDLVARIAVHAPHVHVIVAQLTPIANSPERDSLVVAFNAGIPDLVARQQALSRRVTMVDMYTPLLQYLIEVHPTPEGYGEMARVWHEGILALGPVENPEPGRDDGVRQQDYYSTTTTRPWAPSPPSDNLLRQGATTLESTHEGYDGVSPLSALTDGLGNARADDEDNTWTSTYTFDTSVDTTGYDLTAIRTASGGPGRMYYQAYEVWYSTVAEPDSFARLGDFHAVPVYTTQKASGMVIEGEGGEPLARGVKALQFRFVQPPDRQRGSVHLHDPAGYYEVEALGTPTLGARMPRVLAGAAGNLPQELALLPAAPNPFARATQLRVALPQAGPVRVEAYDALGRRVATLLDRTLGAGTHEVRFDAGALPAGPYFVRLEALGRTLTQPVTRTR